MFALYSYKDQRLADLTKIIQQSIQLCWVASHINIYAGNEQADQEAKAATTNGDATPDIISHSDYYSLMKSSVSFK